MADERIAVALSALRSDWLLAVGALVSARDLRRPCSCVRRRDAPVPTAARGAGRAIRPRPAAAALPAGPRAEEPADGDAGGAGQRDRQRRRRRPRVRPAQHRGAGAAAEPADGRPAQDRRRRRAASWTAVRSTSPPLVEEAIDIAGEQPAAADRRLSVDLGAAPAPAASWATPTCWRGPWSTSSTTRSSTPAPGDRIEVRAREARGRRRHRGGRHRARASREEDLPHIWEELYRSPGARAVPGSGLGLALVRAVVERHGGTVEAESWLGHGTVVRILLPSAGPPEAGAAPGGRTGRQKAAEPAT